MCFDVIIIILYIVYNNIIIYCFVGNIHPNNIFRFFFFFEGQCKLHNICINIHGK